jgi:hypothetical protein
MARNIFSTHYILNAARDVSNKRCTATPNSEFYKRHGGVLNSCAILNSSGWILSHRVSSYLLSSSRTTQSLHESNEVGQALQVNKTHVNT